MKLAGKSKNHREGREGLLPPLPPPNRHFRSGRGSASPALNARAPSWFRVLVRKQDGGWRPLAPARLCACPTPGGSASRPPGPRLPPAPPRLTAVAVPQRAARAQGPAGRCLVTCEAGCASVPRSLSAGAVCGARPSAGSGSDPAASAAAAPRTGWEMAVPRRFTAAPFAAGGRPSLGCNTAAPRSGKARPRGFCTNTKVRPMAACEQPLTDARSGVCTLAKCYNSQNHRVF